MTDRLIRIGSRMFCRAQDLQPGDVIRLIGPTEYTVVQLVPTAGGEVMRCTSPPALVWGRKLSALQEVTVVRAQE